MLMRQKIIKIICTELAELLEQVRLELWSLLQLINNEKACMGWQQEQGLD
jgi:hypothetical protein